MKFPKPLLALSLFLLSACSGAAFWAVNAPASFKRDQVHADIAYGAPGQKLDVYLPAEAVGQKINPNNDVLVFLYGGRWETGAKEDYRFVADAFTRQGFIVVIPDYRKYPDVRFPAFVEDAAKAVAWTSANIQNYGGNPNRVYLAGHSAGAHIGSLLAADERYLKNAGVQPSVIKGFAGLAGPYSFTPDEQDLKDMFGPPANYPQMQATSFIDGHEPPILLLYGAQDDTVGRFNLDKLQKRIEEKHGRVISKIYPNLDHISIVGALSWWKRDDAPVIQDMVSFFKTGQVQK